jgi:hypothetical protein
LKSVEEETGDQTNGTYSILPSSVGQALSLGGYLAAVQKHEGKHVITVGDCQWSVAGKRGKKTKTPEETSRSVEVLKQIQNDQEDRKKATQNVNVGVLKSRYEAIKPDEEPVPIEIVYKRECHVQKCGDPKCGGIKHNQHTPSVAWHCSVDTKKRIVPKSSDKLVPKQKEGPCMLAPVRSDQNTRTIGGKTYKKVSGLVDSGAVDSVTNEKTAPWIPIQQTAASRSGMKYTVADGRTVPNRGQQKFCGTTDDGLPIDMGIQITDVCKTLFSVRKIKEAGNIVIFGAEEGDMIINKRSGSRTKIEDNGKDYQLSIWMEVPKEAITKLGALSSVEDVIREELKTKSVEEVRDQFMQSTMWNRLLGSEETPFPRQDI